MLTSCQIASALDRRQPPRDLRQNKRGSMTLDDTRNSREQRLAAALRANLQRRKQQARGPSGQAEADTPEQPNGIGDGTPSSERSSGET